MLAPDRRETSVYVAVDAEGWHKIGTTADLKLRMYHLGRDRRSEVHLVHSEPQRPNAHWVEIAAHWLLAEHENAREWFNVDEDTALAAVRQAVADVDGGKIPHQRFAYQRRIVLKEQQDAAVRQALLPGESVERFIREAVERELKRRGR